MNIGRRTFLGGTGAAALASVTAFEANAGVPALGDVPNDYFLSRANPVANRDQKELETKAIELYHRDDIREAIKRTAFGFEMVVKSVVSERIWAMFPGFLESYAFRSILLAVNSDANYPKVLRVYSPAAKWMGNDVPESKWGWENPDNAYRIIPVAYGGQYVIRGQRMPNPSRHVSYVLVTDTNTSITAGLLEQSGMQVAPDGSFEITLDDLPANGRKNHIQLTPDAQYVFIRDTMSDWSQTPNALRVERLNAPAHPPLTMDQLAGVAARVMQLGIAPNHYWMGLGQQQVVRAPIMMGPVGGLLTQMSTGGWFRLAPDEAVIVTADAVQSEYHSFVIYDLWGRSLEYRDHFTSLNNAQMDADRDGRFTYVIAPSDPGANNWLDTTGQTELRVNMRWQGLASGAKVPAIETRIVKLADLASALPAGVARATPADRRKQIAERQRQHDVRYAST
jgi:hypothetical protein